MYQQLTSLTIGNCQMSMEDLEYLLALTPSLVHLRLVSYRSTLDSIFVASNWEELIQENLPLLNKFQFFFTCNIDKFNDVDNFDSLILSFQSPFWLKNKKWFVTCNYIPQKLKIRLYTTPPFKDIETRSSKFEVSSTNSECHFILNSNEYMLYKSRGEVSLNFFIKYFIQ